MRGGDDRVVAGLLAQAGKVEVDGQRVCTRRRPAKGDVDLPVDVFGRVQAAIGVEVDGAGFDGAAAGGEFNLPPAIGVRRGDGRSACQSGGGGRCVKCARSDAQRAVRKRGACAIGNRQVTAGGVFDVQAAVGIQIGGNVGNRVQVGQQFVDVAIQRYGRAVDVERVSARREVGGLCAKVHGADGAAVGRLQFFEVDVDVLRVAEAVIDSHGAREVCRCAADRLVGVQCGGERSRRGDFADTAAEGDIDGHEAVDVAGAADDLSVLVERPALQDVARRVLQKTIDVLFERTCAGKQRFRAAVGAHDKHAVAGDGKVCRRLALLYRALQADALVGDRFYRAGAVERGHVFRGDETLERRVIAFITDGADVGDVVGNHAERLALRGKAGSGGEHRTEYTHISLL